MESVFHTPRDLAPAIHILFLNSSSFIPLLIIPLLLTNENNLSAFFYFFHLLLLLLEHYKSFLVSINEIANVDWLLLS